MQVLMTGIRDYVILVSSNKDAGADNSASESA